MHSVSYLRAIAFILAYIGLKNLLLDVIHRLVGHFFGRVAVSRNELVLLVEVVKCFCDAFQRYWTNFLLDELWQEKVREEYVCRSKIK